MSKFKIVAKDGPLLTIHIGFVRDDKNANIDLCIGIEVPNSQDLNVGDEVQLEVVKCAD